MPRGRRKAPVSGVSEPARQDPADGVAALAELAGPVSEPRDLGNFSPEGGVGNQGPAARQRREPKALPTVDDELAERRARGEHVRAVKPGRGESVDDATLTDDAEDDGARAALAPERDQYEPDPAAIFGEGEEPEEGGEPQTAHSLDEYEQRFLAQDNQINTLRAQLEQVSRGGQPAAQPMQSPGQLTPEQVAEIVRYDKLLPFSFNDSTAEQMGLTPQGVQLLDAALRHTVQHVIRIGAQLFGSETARLESRIGEFEPVRRTVDAQQVQQAFYTAHRDLAGYEQEAANIWDQYARAYPQASPEQMIRSVGAATRQYVRERGIRPRQAAAPQQAAPARTSGMLGQQPLSSRRVRPAVADGGGAAGGRLNGSGRPLTAVQAQLAQMAGLNLH